KSHYTFQSSYRIQNYFSSDCTVDYAVYSGCSVWKFKMVHSLRHSFSSYACYNVCHYYCTFETNEMAGVHRLFVDNGYFRIYSCSSFFYFFVFFIIVLLLNRFEWREYFVYLSTMFILGFIPVLLFLSSWSTVLWPSASTALYALLTFVGMVLFSEKTMKNEIVQRFHF